MTAFLYSGTIVAGVKVRVLKEERHQLTSEATQYGVETGESIVDHEVLHPNLVEVEFEMTNSDKGREEATLVMQRFIALRDKRQPMTLYTEHACYKNMVITGFCPAHQAPNKGAFKATLRLAQIGLVGESETVSALGGRPASVLAKDSTGKTAVPLTCGGRVQAIAEAMNPELVNKVAKFRKVF